MTRRRGIQVLSMAADPAAGPGDDITDVPGVLVGHADVRGGSPGRPVRTGVTVVLPRGRESVYADPVVAAVHVVNGFGKLTGMSQIAELGLIESPIALTNTLSVGAVYEGLVDHAVALNPDLVSLNPVVAECNDRLCNDIRTRAVTREHVALAIDDARVHPELGSVGAGSGMVSFGFHSGIGSASRIIHQPGEVGLLKTQFTFGVLVLNNAGLPGELTLPARQTQVPLGAETPDGSVVVVIATDAPLDARQLGRVARRAQNGLARTGMATDHASGEYVLAFSVAGTTLGRREEPTALLAEAFRAAADLTERAVWESLALGEEVVGMGDRRVPQLVPARLAEGRPEGR